MVERSKERELTSPLPLLKGEGVGCFPLRGGGDSSLSYKGRVHPEDSPRGDREGLVRKTDCFLRLRSGQVAPMVSGSRNDSIRRKDGVDG